MITADLTQLLKDYVTPAQTILILFPMTASFDQMASAVALFLGFERMGKSVTIATPRKVPDDAQSLVGVDRVSQQLGNKDLQVSFRYEPDMVEKVSYHIDEDTQKFHLVIQPKKGKPPLNSGEVEFSYTGAEADVIIIIGAQNLESLDNLYFDYEQLFESSPVISVNSFETEFGTIKVDTSGSASASEVTAYLLQEFGAEMDESIATDLLAGIERATESFRSLSTTADTLEIASKLLRAGARRLARASQIGGSFADAFARTNKSVVKIPPEVKLEKTATKTKKALKQFQEDFGKMEGGGRL